jgi:hypothetical protein
VVWGGVSFWRSVIRLDLIDEFRLDLHPYVPMLRPRVPGCSRTSQRTTDSTWSPAPSSVTGPSDCSTAGTAKPAADMQTSRNRRATCPRGPFSSFGPAAQAGDTDPGDALPTYADGGSREALREPRLLVLAVGVKGPLMVVGGVGTRSWLGCVGALRGRGVSADAQAYSGTRLGVATARPLCAGASTAVRRGGPATFTAGATPTST